MIQGFNQKDKRLLRAIQNDGCLFLCFAQQSPLLFEGEEGINALNLLWKKARARGIINENDDLIDHNALANDFFNLNVRYDNAHHDGDENIPEDVAFVFGRFVWKYGHFVIIDRKKNVIYDSLGESYSVKNGALQSMRYYYAEKVSINL